MTEKKVAMEGQNEESDTKQEITELQECMNTVQLSRPSVVSKGKYSRWAMVEEKRLQGEAARVELDALDQQRLASTTEFMSAGHERTQQAREQREAASERVRQHKAKMLSRGTETKAAVEKQRRDHEALRAKWAEHGARMVQKNGTEQRERVLESRSEKFDSLRTNAVEHKQAESDRAAEKIAADARKLEEKRQRVALIRAQTDPMVSRQSKEFFLSNRKAVAADVRASVKDWKLEMQFNHSMALERAAQHHEDAVQSQRQAVDGQAILREQRKQDAADMRACIVSIVERKEHQRLTELVHKREHHDESFESRFVSTPMAEHVVTSNYDAVGNAHREELANRDNSRAIVGKPSWFNFFYQSGTGWFGNPYDLDA